MPKGGAMLSQVLSNRFDCGRVNDTHFPVTMYYKCIEDRFGDPQFHTKSKSRLVSITKMTTRTWNRKQPLIMCLAYPKYDRLMIGTGHGGEFKWGRAVQDQPPGWLFVRPESQFGKINLAQNPFVLRSQAECFATIWWGTDSGSEK